VHTEITSLEQLSRERQHFDNLRRTICVVAGVIGLVIIGYDTLWMLGQQPSPFHWIFLGNNLLFAAFAAVVTLLAALRRVEQERLEQVTLGVFAVESLLFNGIVPGLLNPSLALTLRDTLGDDIWFLLIICILILHIFPLRRAFWLATGFYLLSTLIVLWRVSRGLPAPDADAVPLIVRTYLFGAALVTFCYLLVRFRDNLRQLRFQHSLLQQLAYIDPLTQVHNRRYIDHALREQIAVAQRYPHPLCVLLCDVDHFKQINDDLGHGMGDTALAGVARLLRENVRASDVVGRWGGEEFIVVMHMTTLEDATVVADRVCAVIAAARVLGERRVTVSIGLAMYRPDDTFDTLLQRADAALYRAKGAGRNQVQIAAPLPA
jgi:diguanylate cyclase